MVRKAFQYLCQSWNIFVSRFRKLAVKQKKTWRNKRKHCELVTRYTLNIYFLWCKHPGINYERKADRRINYLFSLLESTLYMVQNRTVYVHMRGKSICGTLQFFRCLGIITCRNSSRKQMVRALRRHRAIPSYIHIHTVYKDFTHIYII